MTGESNDRLEPEHTRPVPECGMPYRELPLLERAQDQERLAATLAQVGARCPALVALEGRPGEGQNALLRWTARRACAQGLRVLYARATPVESELRHGVLHQLLAGAGGSARTSSREETAEQQPAALPGLAGLLRSASAQPVLVCVEDVQWADAASREWLQALVRRLHMGVPVALAVSSSLSARGWSWLTAPSPAAVRVTNVVMRPLSPGGVDAVTELVYGKPCSVPFNTAAGQATGGSPALLHEALRRFRLRGHRPVPERVPELRAVTDEAVSDAATSVLDGLPAEATAAMRALAVCGDMLDFALVRTLTSPRALPESELLSMLDAAGLIVTEGSVVRVRHPAVKNRVLERMPPAERAELHVGAAALAHRAAADDEDIASILFRAPAVGAPWVLETLQRSSAAALSRGDHRHARACLTRALLEPLQPADRARLTLELAEAEIVVAPEAGERRLGNLVRSEASWRDGTPLRAIDAGLARGNEGWSCATAAEALPAARGEMYHDLIALHWLAHRDHHDETGLVLRAVPPLPVEPVTPAQAGVRAWQLATHAEDMETSRALARACLDHQDPGEAAMPRLAACKALFAAAETEEAHAGLGALLDGARRSHSWAAASRVLTARAEINLRGGRLDAAERDIEAAEFSLPLTSWHPAAAPNLMAVSISVALESGRYDLARRLARTPAPEGAASGTAWCQLLFARAQVACQDERWPEMLRLSRECGRLLLLRRRLNPALLPWRSMAAHALCMLGEREEAERLAAEELLWARHWGTRAAVGLVTLITAPVAGDGGTRGLEEAARAFEGAADGLLHAWSLVQLAGSELSAGNHRAAARAAAGLTRFTTTYPSSRLAETVRRLTEELGRPANPAYPADTRSPLDSDALSEAERETARLAGRGHGNREIADLLSVSTRAVELRLSSVYKKLNLTGRKELRSMVHTSEGRPTGAA